MDAQKLFNTIRNDYAQFLRFYREHYSIHQKLELVEAQIQDVIAIPCSACGHTINNCSEVTKKGHAKSETQGDLSSSSIVNRLFEEVKSYLEEYNSSTDKSPVSATLTADNSILFCKLQKTENPDLIADHKAQESQFSVSTKSKWSGPRAQQRKPGPSAGIYFSHAPPSRDQAHWHMHSDMSIGLQELGQLRPPTPTAFTSHPQSTLYNPELSHMLPPEIGTQRTIKITGAGGRNYHVGYDGPLNQYGLPFGPGLVTHNGIKYFSDWGTCRWGNGQPFLRSRNDTNTLDKDMVYYPDGSVFLGVLGNSYGRLFFRATGTVTYPDGKILHGNWDPDDISFAIGQKEYVKNPGEFLADFTGSS
jgi:hypothetical protein